MGGVALVARETGRPGTAAAALGLAVWLLLLARPGDGLRHRLPAVGRGDGGPARLGHRLTRRLTGGSPGTRRAAGSRSRWACRSRHRRRRCRWSCPLRAAVARVAAREPARRAARRAGDARGCGRHWSRASPWESVCRPWSVPHSRCSAGSCWARWSRLPVSSARCPSRASSCPPDQVAMALAGRPGRRDSWCCVAGARATRHAERPSSRFATTGRPLRCRPVAIRRAITSRPARPPRALVAAVAAIAVLAVAGSGRGRQHPGSRRLSVTTLDVGQGDAILVEGPHGGRLLLDSGPDPDRLLTVLDRHVPAWDRHLDLVILTHPHEDHVAGLADAARALPCGGHRRERDARRRPRRCRVPGVARL